MRRNERKDKVGETKKTEKRLSKVTNTQHEINKQKSIKFCDNL